MSLWYYVRKGKKHGPLEASDLKKLAKAGQLRPTDRIWREGLEEYLPASSVKGLFGDTDQVAPARSSETPAAKRVVRSETIAGSSAAEGSFDRSRAVTVAVVSVAAVVLMGFMLWAFVLRDTWERDYGAKIRGMVGEVRSSARSGRYEEAVEKHKELVGFLGERRIKDADLQSQLRLAWEAAEEAGILNGVSNTKKAAELAAAQGDLRGALVGYRQAQALLGETELKTEALDNAAEEIKSSLQTAEDAAYDAGSALMSQGDRARREGSPEGALSKYAEALAALPENPISPRLIGLASRLRHGQRAAEAEVAAQEATGAVAARTGARDAETQRVAADAAAQRAAADAAARKARTEANRREIAALKSKVGNYYANLWGDVFLALADLEVAVVKGEYGSDAARYGAYLEAYSRVLKAEQARLASMPELSDREKSIAPRITADLMAADNVLSAKVSCAIGFHDVALKLFGEEEAGQWPGKEVPIIVVMFATARTGLDFQRAASRQYISTLEMMQEGQWGDWQTRLADEGHVVSMAAVKEDARAQIVALKAMIAKVAAQ